MSGVVDVVKRDAVERREKLFGAGSFQNATNGLFEGPVFLFEQR